MKRILAIIFCLISLQVLQSQDICSSAYDLGTINCGDSESDVGDAGTTPDVEATACMIGLDGTWFNFSTNDALPEFTISGTDYELFDGSCGSLNFIDGCGNGIVVATSPGTQYYILVNGDFSIVTDSPPLNDDCSSAADATGGISGEDNSCSDSDLSLCGSDGNATVWYSYFVAQDLESFEIEVVSSGISNAVIGFYSDCSTQIMEECSSLMVLECVAAGNYYIQIGSDFDNTGTFDLTFSETASSVSNDNCETPDDVTPSSTCAAETVSGDSSGACPESTDFGSGCDFDINPTVWFEFSTSSETVSVDFTNLSSNLELLVFEGSCSGPVFPCITGDNTITVNGNTSYLIAAALTTGGGSIEFDITLNEPPSNDACSNAASLGSGEGTNTCCGIIEGLDECGGSETGVWFEYIGPDGDGSQYDFTNIDMTGTIGIEIYEGDCGGLTLLNDPYCGGAGSYTFETPNCGADAHYIHITSSSGGCGNFELTVTPLVGCAFGESCGDGPTISPTTGGSEDCATGCNEFACDSDCSVSGVWFIVETDELATEMSVVVNNVGGSNVDPVVSIIQSECSGGALVVCEDVASGDIIETAVSGNQLYYIEVSTGSGGDPGEFEVCVTTTESLVECSDGDVEPTRPEYPDADPLGPYCPGEIVNFCYDVTFTVDPGGQGNNCQWIQGIIPTLGGGWDLDALAIDIQGPGGSWFWLEEEEVEYNATSSILGLIDTPHGLGLEYGPGTLTQGDGLPGAWWSVSNGGGPTCTNDGNPNTMWGLPAGCGSTVDVSFCFDLQVGLLDDIAQCGDPEFTDLRVHIFTMADGQTGCWSNNSCSGDTPVTFNAIIDCTSLVFILAEDTEMCSDDVLNIPVETEDGSDTDITVTVIEEGNTSGASDWEFTGGVGVIADQIENEGEDVEIVLYEAYASDPESICEGPRTIIEVIVYPEIVIEGDDPYYICYQDPREIEPLVSGGDGGPYNYLWEDGSKNSTITLPLDPDLGPGVYQIQLTVTDEFGCSKLEFLEYEIVEPLYPEIINPYTGVCKDGIEDLPELFLEFESAGTGPYEFLWQSSPGGLDYENGDNDQNLIINEEKSSARTYTIFGTVIDDHGCEYTVETELTVDNGPDMVLEVVECQGSIFLLSGYERDNQFVNFELYYDEDGDWVYDGMTILNAELVATQFGDNISYLAEKFGTYLLLGISANGCIDYIDLELPPIQLPQFEVLPNDTICAGTEITVTVTNDNEYVDYNWSNGENGSSFLDSPLDTITYYLVAETNEDCEVIDSVTVVVNPIPPVIVTGSRAICPGSETVLTVQGNAGFSYLWNGPNGEMITTQTANISAIGEWNVMVVSDGGCINSKIILIEENSQLNPEIDGANLCTGSSIILDGGQGFDEYTWFNDAGVVIGTKQTVEVFEGGTYNLSVILGSGQSACSGEDDFTVLQFDPVTDALNAMGTEVCNIDDGSLATMLDLTSFENGVSGNWLDNNNLPVANPESIDFTGRIPGNYQYRFVSNSAVFPCVDRTFPFVITVLDCSCPSVAINRPPDFCNTVDTFDLNLLKVTNEDGTWSISPAAIEILGSQMILDQNTMEGDYIITLSLTDPNLSPGCQRDSSVALKVYGRFEAELIKELSVCNEDTGNGSVTIDLDDFIVLADAGVWSTNEMGISIDVDNVVSFEGQQVGDYRFFYTVEDVISACPSLTRTVTVEVIDCSCPVLDISPLVDLCNTGGTLVLRDFLINPENRAGTWSINGPDNSALVANSILALDREPGLYELSFSFTNPVGGSCINTVTQTLNIYEPPEAVVSDEEFACNGTSITVYPTTLDLNNYVSGASGIWTAPDEYNNGIIDDIFAVDFEGYNPGIYSFTYTTNTALLPCEESIYSMDVIVRNCNCPFVAFVPPTPLCNDGPDVDLNDYLQIGSPAGSWSFINGTPAVDIQNSTIFPINNLDGFYLFQYTLESVPEGCPDFGQISLQFVSPPSVNHVPDAKVCNVQSVIADNCVDLNDYLSGVVGSWSSPENFDGDASDIGNVCFDIDDIGELLTFTFTTETGSITCDERSYETVFEIIDCNCPNLLLNQPQAICNSIGTFDLSQLESVEIEPGSWSFVSGPEELNITNTILNLASARSGIYTLQYTPEILPSIDCNQFALIGIEIVNQNSAGVVINDNDCIAHDQSVILEDYLSNSDEGGLWELNGEDLLTDSQGNTYFNAIDYGPGQYILTYGFYNNTPCEEVFVELQINILPIVDTEVLDSPCADENSGSIIIASIDSGNENLYSIDGGLSWTSNELFDNLAPGTYNLLIEDSNGCQFSLEDIVVSEPGPLTVNAGEDREVEEDAGSIRLQLVNPVDISEIEFIEWTVDGKVFCSGSPELCWEIDVVPDGAAEYCARVIDINGCESEDCIILRERVVFDVYLPDVFMTGSPNNSVFFVQSDEYISTVNSMMIYDRWGNLVFNALPNHPPNEKEYGWDGTMNDSYVNQGVYVYVIKLTYIDGKEDVFAGDITLLRD